MSSVLLSKNVKCMEKQVSKESEVSNAREGPTEIWTRIARFKVWSANHYTIEPVGKWKTAKTTK